MGFIYKIESQVSEFPVLPPSGNNRHGINIHPPHMIKYVIPEITSLMSCR